MMQEFTGKRASLSGEARVLTSKLSWHRLALGAILTLSAFLNLFWLAHEGYANSYYAAAVKNMLTSWHNFFFVSSDAGFVSVDKPPLGLWIQAASAWLFGFHGWALLLPQALAGVLSVALLYHLVRRSFGPVAGLLAALVLAVTPIVVAASRNNTADMLLVLSVLLAAWAVIQAAERGSLKWLLVGAALVGLGFNIKMLQAFLVLPAFYLVYLIAAPLTWWRRFLHLGIATAVLLAVSLSWAVVVDVTPQDQRPYVGSSQNNSVLDLAFGYNGLERLMGGDGPPGGGNGQAAQKDASQGDAPEFGPGGGPGGIGENGAPGPFRLLDQQLAGQIGWLLPLAVVGLLAAGWQRRLRLPLDRRQQALVLWGTWLLTMAAYFSIAGMGHRYYLVMLAPAIAALVGAGVVALWSDYRNPGWRGWLLPLTLVGMAGLQAYILADYEGWNLLLTPVISGLCLVAAGALVVARLRSRSKTRAFSYSAGAATAGVLALLIAPLAWGAYTVFEGTGGLLPSAGPWPTQEEGGVPLPGGPPPGSGGGSGGGGGGGPFGPGEGSALVEYLEANQGDAEYLVATPNSMSASPISLHTDEPVISLGGFMGRDPVFTGDELAGLVDRGAVRFFLLEDRERMAEMFSEMAKYFSGDDAPAQGDGPPEGAPVGPPPGGLPGMDSEAVTWVEGNCEQVPEEQWRPSDSEDTEGPVGIHALYDCAGAGT